MSDPLADAIRQSTEFEAYKEERILRDQMAMAALQGLIAGTGNAQRNIQREAMEAYFYADAMLEARRVTK